MKRTVLAAVGVAIASLGLAQLVKDKDWAKSPEAYFLTPQERSEWSAIASDAEADKFIAAYWAKRGGERFKEGVERRIAAADEQFKQLHQRGSESARGHIFIVLGSPARRAQSRPNGGGEDSGMGSGRSNFAGDNPLGTSSAVLTETWTYGKEQFDPSWGVSGFKATILVDPQRGADSVQNADEVNRVLVQVAERSIVAPPAPAANAPTPAAGQAGPAPTAVAPLPAAAATLPTSAKASLEALLSEKKEAADFWGGSFRAPTGEPFYALQFYFPGEKAPAAGAKFGGVVSDESGSNVASFWEDATFVGAKTGTRQDKVYERSVVLPPGSYKGAFGIFAGEGAAVESASVAFRLEPKSAEFEVSPLILANELTPLTQRPKPTDPFVFGVEKPIRVPPKGDATFSKQDSLWYFYEVANPTVAEAAATAAAAPAPTPGATATATTPTAPAALPKPRIMQRIGVLRDGKPAFAPFTGPADAQMLSPGVYGSGSEIPLATFVPGYYMFTLNVRDLNAPKDSAAFKGIDREASFVVLNPDGTMPAKTAPAVAPTPKPKPRKS